MLPVLVSPLPAFAAAAMASACIWTLERREARGGVAYVLGGTLALVLDVLVRGRGEAFPEGAGASTLSDGLGPVSVMAGMGARTPCGAASPSSAGEEAGCCESDVARETPALAPESNSALVSAARGEGLGTPDALADAAVAAALAERGIESCVATVRCEAVLCMLCGARARQHAQLALSSCAASTHLILSPGAPGAATSRSLPSLPAMLTAPLSLVLLLASLPLLLSGGRALTLAYVSLELRRSR